MGYKAAAQILKSAEDLKAKVSRKCDLLNDTQAWTDQQRLQTVCHQVLVLDLEYALDKKVEQDLWNIGFKIHISTLQDLIRDKKNPKRSDYQALLTWSLEAATGFYISLLQELCNTFSISFSFRKPGNVFGQIKEITCQESLIISNSNVPQKSSCLYICQYCLVHLGDIARYRNQRKQAENFYKQAIEVSPFSGHPYNQLALLQASQGDKLSTVYYYVRGISVKNPFPAAIPNLASTFNSILDKDSYLQKIQTKITVNEFIHLFLCTHEHLQTLSDLKQAEIGVKNLNSTMTALVATHSFTSTKLIHITVINIYTLKHLTSKLDKSVFVEALTEDEKTAVRLVMELLSGLLSAFLVPVHTLKMDESVLDYYALPAVKLLIYWIMNEPEVLSNAAFVNKLQIWPSLCKLLNNGATFIKDFDDYTKFENVPLSEDRELQGFLPFQDNFNRLNFELPDLEDATKEKLIRMKHIVEFGTWLCNLKEPAEFRLITKKEEIFEPSCMQPDPTNDLLEEIKSFNVSHNAIETIKSDSDKKSGGILKPQGSLEKNREERELLSSSEASSSGNSEGGSGSTVSSGLSLNGGAKQSNNNNNNNNDKMKRVKHNAALQSIFKKMEESKQVKFTEPDKEKPVLVKQTYVQHHTANKNDYLNSLRNIGNNTIMDNKEVIPFQNYARPPPPVGQNKPQPQQQINRNLQMMQLPPPPIYQSLPPPLGATPFNSNVWKPDELLKPPPPPNPQTWWQNNNSYHLPVPPINFQIPPPTAQNFHGYSNNNNNNSSSMFVNNFEPKPPLKQQQQHQQFNNSPWHNIISSPQHVPINNNAFMSGIDENSRGISMRQAMLKEAASGLHHHNMQPPPQQPGGLNQTDKNNSGYSLFNANSWSPNLVGQLRTSKSNESHQNVFAGQPGPQSLAQLLEQQSRLRKNDS